MKRNPWKIVSILLFLVIMVIILKPTGLLNKATSLLPIPKPTLARKTYQEWKKVGGDFISAYCNRSEMHEMNPEFSRAISLIQQRAFSTSDTGLEGPKQLQAIAVIQNCLDIQYADSSLNGSEGVFYFDDKVSNRETLRISVSRDYLAQDDLMTAFLLSHEIRHAIQFVEAKSWEAALRVCNKNDTKEYCEGLVSIYKNPDCYEMEANAFLTQYLFLFSLKKSESNALMLRANQEEIKNADPQIRGMMNIMLTITPIIQNCNGNYECVTGQTKIWIMSNPAYQKQCNGSN